MRENTGSPFYCSLPDDESNCYVDVDELKVIFIFMWYVCIYKNSVLV
jgi:hypothetical protein